MFFLSNCLFFPLPPEPSGFFEFPMTYFYFVISKNDSQGDVLVGVFSSATGWIHARLVLLSAPTPAVGQYRYELSRISSTARKIRNTRKKTRFPAHFNLLHIRINLKMKNIPRFHLNVLVIRACRMSRSNSSPVARSGGFSVDG